MDIKTRLQQLEQFHRLDPQNPVLTRELAKTYFEAGEHAQALRLYDQINDTNDPGVLNEAGAVYMALGRWAEAAEIFRRALAGDPGAAAIHFNLGYASLAAGDAASAIPHLKEAVHKGVPSPRARYFLALAFYDNGQSGAAQEALDELLRLESNHLEGQLLSAYLAMDGNRFDDAEQVLQAVVAAHPDAVEAWSQRGQVALMRMDAPAAEKIYRHALGFTPENVDLLVGLGQALLMLHKYDQAETALHKAVERDPRSAAACLALAWSYLFRNELALADQWLQRAMELDSESAETLAALALVRIGQERRDEATRLADRALRLDAASVPALLAQSQLAEAKGQDHVREYARRMFESGFALVGPQGVADTANSPAGRYLGKKLRRIARHRARQRSTKDRA